MIELADVRFAYPGDPPALRIDRLVFDPGLTLVLGPNGSGKSTLLRIAAAVEKPDAGTVRIGGLDPWVDEVAARRDLAWVPEHPELTPYATIGEIVHLVARLRGEPVEAASRALSQVGLADAPRRSVRELSQGQRRRADLAAALVGTPRVLVLDEPLEAMDRGMRDVVVGWIRDARARGATVVVATHDLEELRALADAAVGLSEGRARTVEPLPDDAGERDRLLEGLARGG
jgi:ABC-type multidrug transport system ATPase subunit